MLGPEGIPEAPGLCLSLRAALWFRRHGWFSALTEIVHHNSKLCATVPRALQYRNSGDQEGWNS